MIQMKISEDAIIPIDYDSNELSDFVKELRPVVFMEGDSFCCLLGPNQQEGIFGCGDSSDEAIEDWEKTLNKRLDKAEDDDEIANYVKDSLNASNRKVW